jgi:hypothetical protein
MATRSELVAVTAERYARATRRERGRILDEFTGVTGFHRNHALRLLRAGVAGPRADRRPGRRVYDEVVRAAQESCLLQIGDMALHLAGQASRRGGLAPFFPGGACLGV